MPPAANTSLAGFVRGLLVVALVLLAGPALASQEGPWQVCFTPGEDCESEIVFEIAHADREVLVQAYGFTSAPIATALIEAHRRGVTVEVILDKSNRKARYSEITRLVAAGVVVAIDERPAIAHNKVMIFDGATVMTGSFNFTKAANTRNAENLIFIHDPDVARKYAGNWHSRWSASVLYRGRGARPSLTG